MVEQYPIVWMYHVFIIHSLVDGHLGSFYFLAIMNNVHLNIQVQVCVDMLSFLLDIYV